MAKTVRKPRFGYFIKSDMAMTNEELKRLKRLAEMAKPFNNATEETAEYWARRKVNEEFFAMSHEATPDMVDEILLHRAVQKRPGPGEFKE